jgi:hypothetical protein
MIGIIVFIAFVVLFFHEPGCALALVGLVALVAVGIWYFAIKAPQDALTRRETAVTVSVRYDTLLCGDKKRRDPLLVVVRNGSDQTVRKVEWWTKVTESGHSTDLATGNSQGETDVILQPGQETSGCWALPEGVEDRSDASGLVYDISGKAVMF